MGREDHYPSIATGDPNLPQAKRACEKTRSQKPPVRQELPQKRANTQSSRNASEHGPHPNGLHHRIAHDCHCRHDGPWTIEIGDVERDGRLRMNTGRKTQRK